MTPIKNTKTFASILIVLLTLFGTALTSATTENNYRMDNSVLTEQVRDVAVTNIWASKTVVSQTYTMYVSVRLENQGDSEEMFRFDVYANATIIQTQIALLGSKLSTIKIIKWNTTGFAKGSYTISVYAHPVPNETDIADNSLIDGTVRVVMVGDVNADGEADGKDISIIAKYFDKPAYDYPNADINSDFEIDGKDLSITAKNFGKIDP